MSDMLGLSATESGQGLGVKASIMLEARSLGGLTLANLMLRNQPNAGQALLSSTSAAQRLALVEQWLSYGDSREVNWQSLLIFALPLIPVVLGLAYFVLNYVV